MRRQSGMSPTPFRCPLARLLAVFAVVAATLALHVVTAPPAFACQQAQFFQVKGWMLAGDEDLNASVSDAYQDWLDDNFSPEDRSSLDDAELEAPVVVQVQLLESVAVVQGTQDRTPGAVIAVTGEWSFAGSANAAAFAYLPRDRDEECHVSTPPGEIGIGQLTVTTDDDRKHRVFPIPEGAIEALDLHFGPMQSVAVDLDEVEALVLQLEEGAEMLDGDGEAADEGNVLRIALVIGGVTAAVAAVAAVRRRQG